MRTFLLKFGATVLTLASTAVSALYVTAHLKNASAPLQPTVINGQDASVSAFGGSVTVGPSVHQSDVQPVTSTYAS
jgi:hypothetical protein